MVIEERLPFYRFGQLESLRNVMKNTKKSILVTGESGEQVRVSINSLLKETTFQKSYEQMLFRLSRYFHPKQIVDFGSSTGLSSLYMATPFKDVCVTAMERDPEVASLCRLNIKRTQVENVKVVVGDLKNKTRELVSSGVCFDFIHFGRSCSTSDIRSLVEILSGTFSWSTVILISDIYRTEEKENLWQDLKNMPGVRVSLELFFYGILIFDENFQKESYNLFYLPSLFNK